MVIERTNYGERAFDIYSRLLKDRIVCLHGPVNEGSSSVVVAQLLYLESVNPELPINLYINCPGGTVHDGLAIYDTMKYVSCPIHTVCMGMAASMGSLLLTAGTKGKRFSLPNSRIMIHQPSGGAYGQATDIAIQAKEILKTRHQVNLIYAAQTGQSVEIVNNAMERDNYMNPQEAVEFGLIDKVIEKRLIPQTQKE